MGESLDKLKIKSGHHPRIDGTGRILRQAPTFAEASEGKQDYEGPAVNRRPFSFARSAVMWYYNQRIASFT